MSKDILKEYFDQRPSIDVSPRDGYQEELIKSLNRRIVKLERRQRVCSVLAVAFAIIMVLLLINFYVPLCEISIPAIDVSPLNLVLFSLLFIIIFIGSYVIDAMRITELRRRLGLLS